MEQNWFGNIFKRLSTEVGSDLERAIVGDLEGLLDHPNDENLIDATIQQLTADPRKFMSIVSAHFSVPMPVAALRDRLPHKPRRSAGSPSESRRA
jgi:hypothetical protein